MCRVVWFSAWRHLPHVERDGDYRVEHDGVREEDEQRDDRRSAQRVVGNLFRPRQVDLEPIEIYLV